MHPQSSPVPTLDQLRALARLHGVDPTDADLEAVTGFLETILPALAEIEAGLALDVAPAGVFRDEP
jgi:hypothetical protein